MCERSGGSAGSVLTFGGAAHSGHTELWCFAERGRAFVVGQCTFRLVGEETTVLVAEMKGPMVCRMSARQEILGSILRLANARANERGLRAFHYQRTAWLGGEANGRPWAADGNGEGDRLG